MNLTSVLINVPIIIFNIMANAFYMFCMICPSHGERIKQPRALLLWSSIWNTTTYLMSFFFKFFTQLVPENDKIAKLSIWLSICSLLPSISSTVLLNFFYYTQIVPAQRAFFICIKKNNKPIIYCMWLVEKMLILLYFTTMVYDFIIFDGFRFSNTITMGNDTHVPERTVLILLNNIAFDFTQTYFYFSLCIMVMSSGATLVYLCRHMRRMVANGQTYSSPRFRSQVRVTVTGIFQGVLFVFLTVWIMYYFVFDYKPSLVNDPLIHFTVLNLYMSGTTINLGVGQAVFRQRAADIWSRAAQWFRASKVHESKPESEDQTRRPGH